MNRVAIVGCGVVGAAIAYELSQFPDLEIIVLDHQPPAQAATGAALGVLMGIISHKVKGRTWQLRQASMRRYETLIPELQELTGCTIPFNQHGILSLCFTAKDLARWQELANIRRSQAWPLEIWSVEQLQARCPQLKTDQVVAAIYSPRDRQVDPTALTLALVAAAKRNGVTFRFGEPVQGFDCSSVAVPENSLVCQHLQTSTTQLSVDWIVIAAGLGSTSLTATADHRIELRPVLGQALQAQLTQPLGHQDFQPVINGDDIHIVPLGQGQYWLGATVEFPPDTEVQDWDTLQPEADRLQAVLAGAIAFCPALADAKIVKTWSGLRPRPQGQPAPIIGPLPGYHNVLMATGHYRNGVLLAPATAQRVRELIRQ
ncbi:MAG: FAD-binding oxidoreductase [Cyanothece sp. SIO1E1]|nr:FAD-binding oxidoreductase [Cyanothece sp. SIO1E1]